MLEFARSTVNGYDDLVAARGFDLDQLDSYVTCA